MKKGPTTPIRKHGTKLKFPKKTMWRTFKQYLRSDLNPLCYAMWDVFVNKINASSHPNIGLLKTAFEEEWNKMSEEFILKGEKIVSKACWYNNWKNNGGHIE